MSRDVPADVIAAYDQVMAYARDAFPEKSVEWRETWILRLYWAEDHDGDMTGAPEFP